jgi:hypothetical protein
MKRLFFLILLIFVGVTVWRISERLSADAIGMALGVLFGVLAGLPVALLVLASARRRESWQDEGHGPQRRSMDAAGHGYPMPVQQPPVIVLAGPGYPAMQQGHQYPGANPMLLPPPQEMAGSHAPHRSFKVIGEQVADIEEW